MKKKILIAVAFLLAILGCFCAMYFDNKELNDSIGIIQNVVYNEIDKYEMTETDIEELPSTEIIEQTISDEEAIEEQKVEDEGFELQGEIAYEGDRANTWNVSLGDYTGLTYYSQIDIRWKNKMFSSVNDGSQTIGSSGCGPTSAAMIVTAIKGTITPDTMADLFVQHGYRSANNGTYWSAFRAIADEFNIEYQETSNFDNAINLLNNNNYLVASVGNGLFTTGGHFIVLVGIEGNNIKIYDPYLYAGKFDTSTRRGKVTVSGNTVYCSIDNFRKYANYKGFFAYKHNGSTQENNSKEVVTSPYTRYVVTNSKNLNVRNAPNGKIIGSLKKGTQVTVYSVSGNWSNIGNGRWVSSEYLGSLSTSSTSKKYSTGRYKVTGVSKNSVLYVRSGPSTKYVNRKYYQLTSNARNQNKNLGNYYANGYKNGVVFNVSKISGEWGYTPSGWVNLKYCSRY